MTDPYERFGKEDLILRDELAVDRTLLANERTLLAYLRSGVALILAGATFINFSNAYWFKILGVACIPIGIVVMVIGSVRYLGIKKRVEKAKKRDKLNF